MSKNIEQAYKMAQEQYAALGVDTDKALARLQNTEISVHCWQGDDLIGFEEGAQQLSGGIMSTGKYPGRARNGEELRSDYEKAFSLIPGKQRANLHAIYLEANGKIVGRDQIETKHFENWMDWANQQGVSLDFNTTIFSHPKADGYTLANYDKSIRDFWIEHARRCRLIGEEMGKRQGNPCILNHWMIDGSKEPPVDRLERRRLYIESMDEILSKNIAPKYLMDSIESKLFGIGLESFTAGSAEMCFAYALTRKIALTYDLGHFHPTESVADKISSTLLFLDKIMLHVSRGVRWDSDHVAVQNDELYSLMQEVVRADALEKINIGLDFFDGSINHVAAWVIGTRAAQKSILSALLEPLAMMRQAELEEDTTSRLVMLEETKNLPLNAVWEYYCMMNGVPVGMQWLEEVKKYEKTELSKRI